MNRPALSLPSRTLQAVAQGMRQLHCTPSSWADLLESFGAGVRAQLDPMLVELTREGAHPRLIATLLESWRVHAGSWSRSASAGRSSGQGPSPSTTTSVTPGPRSLE
jgi:hypothetical protein